MRLIFRNTVILVFLLSFFINYAVAQVIKVPEMQNELPAAGKRVKVIPPEYAGTDVYYSLYLPTSYKTGGKYPVIVEYTGNEFPPSGSTGQVKDANLGYVPATEIDAIWMVLPYVAQNESILKWWGNEDETIEFALKNIKRVCENYGGNPAEIFLCGFSRGAIAVNYLGLYNPEIADVWIGFFSHDHYDGAQEWKGKTWGSPLETYRESALKRAQRFSGRAALISTNTPFVNNSPLRNYVHQYGIDTLAHVSFNEFSVTAIVTDIPNEHIPHPHTDKWMLYPSKEKEKVLNWFKETLLSKPGTFSVSGFVRDKNGRPLKGVYVETGETHFTKTDANGAFYLEGLVGGKRLFKVYSKKQPDVILLKRELLVSKNLQHIVF